MNNRYAAVVMLKNGDVVVMATFDNKRDADGMVKCVVGVCVFDMDRGECIDE